LELRVCWVREKSRGSWGLFRNTLESELYTYCSNLKVECCAQSSWKCQRASLRIRSLHCALVINSMQVIVTIGQVDLALFGGPDSALHDLQQRSCSLHDAGIMAWPAGEENPRKGDQPWFGGMEHSATSRLNGLQKIPSANIVARRREAQEYAGSSP
jgi:hypothetical protein